MTSGRMRYFERQKITFAGAAFPAVPLRVLYYQAQIASRTGSPHPTPHRRGTSTSSRPHHPLLLMPVPRRSMEQVVLGDQQSFSIAWRHPNMTVKTSNFFVSSIALRSRNNITRRLSEKERCHLAGREVRRDQWRRCTWN